MKTTTEHDARIAKMIFASVYPHYVTKVESKGRTKEELHQVIKWLTGFDEKKLQVLIDEKVSFETFFQEGKTQRKRSPDNRRNLWLPDRRNRKPLDKAGEVFRQARRRTGKGPEDGKDSTDKVVNCNTHNYVYRYNYHIRRWRESR